MRTTILARNLADLIPADAFDTPVRFGPTRHGHPRTTTLGEVVEMIRRGVSVVMVGVLDGHPWLAEEYTRTSEALADLSPNGPPAIQIPAGQWMPMYLTPADLMVGVRATEESARLLRDIHALDSAVTDWGWSAGQNGAGEEVVQIGPRAVYRRVTHPTAGDVYVAWSPSATAYHTYGTADQIATIRTAA